MTGSSLARQLFDEVVQPFLATESRIGLSDVAAAFLGDGSEVLGFDDALSQDHNFAPRVIVFIVDEALHDAAAGLRQRLLRSAPSRVGGFELLDDAHRRSIDVVPLQPYFRDYLGVDRLPESHLDWLRLDEQKLLELTSGEIFHDPTGQLQSLRGDLAFYPDPVRDFLMLRCLVRLTEADGIIRAAKRNDTIATAFYRTWFAFFAIRVLHLCVGAYCPYRKWMGRSLLRLGTRGASLHTRLESLLRASDSEEIESRCMDVLGFLAECICGELGLGAFDPRIDRELHLLPFNWDGVLTPLTARVPAELSRLAQTAGPPSTWGLMFDIGGFGDDVEAFLQANLATYRGAVDLE